jgi:hypothetical protein
MKTLTFDETKWKLVPIEPTSKQLQDTAFNMCCKYGREFVQDKSEFAQDIYSEMLANAPEPYEWEPSFHGASTDAI